ncbi:DUF5615 family PIN-like protein [Candidatus Acetothermia bacterium]|nr:DUF5615 family PIN-like protein [Candidatus Acetothermia bacterium]MBI3658997.1 DUF5615 family PIN-like protein [Candidatus Acetothermia bacterium]
MKFLADMGISPRTAAWLQQLGHDAIHLHAQGLDRLPDPDILSKARKEERVLLTSDLDFGYLLAVSRAQLPSVVIFRLADMRPSSVHHYLEQVLKQCQQELAQGAIVIVTERRIRVRTLPI